MSAVTILIVGKVQGVSFRYHAKELAKSLGVEGWVRNRIDGSVEIFLQGDPTFVNQLVKWCRKGPSEAKVEDVSISHSPVDPTVAGFKVRPTC